MINYKPLVKTLKDKNMSIYQLADLIHMERNWFRRNLNSGALISLKTVDKICTALECTISDVIDFKPGPQKISRYRDYLVDVDWSEIKDCKTQSEEIGKSRTYLLMMSKKNQVKESTAKRLEKELGIKLIVG